MFCCARLRRQLHAVSRAAVATRSSGAKASEMRSSVGISQNTVLLAVAPWIGGRALEVPAREAVIASCQPELCRTSRGHLAHATQRAGSDGVRSAACPEWGIASPRADSNVPSSVHSMFDLIWPCWPFFVICTRIAAPAAKVVGNHIDFGNFLTDTLAASAGSPLRDKCIDLTVKCSLDTARFRSN